MKKYLVIFIFLWSALSIAQEKNILYWGELIQKNVTSENSSYTHYPTIVTWKGIDGADKYECRADCSSFISELIKKAYNIDQDVLNHWLHKTKRAYSKDFYNNIIKENGFKKITNIKDALPGDLIAIKFPKLMDNTGHSMLISELPVEIESSKPIIEGTKQWKVKIIDESAHGHGYSDSRYISGNKFHTGLGTGYFRIYTDEFGEICGYCWSTEAGSKYQKADVRKIVIGRIQGEFH